MGNLNKTYLGYRPKDDNVVKLAQYLAVKNDFKANKNTKNKQYTKLSSNKIMNNIKTTMGKNISYEKYKIIKIFIDDYHNSI